MKRRPSRPLPLPDRGDQAGDTALAPLLERIRACRICRDAARPPALAHEPRPVVQMGATARLLIAGQAPGTRVHASGRPFDDRSGDRLRDWLGLEPSVFYDAARVAILPMGFCFPGQDARGADLPPRLECAPAWRSRALAALPRIELILAVGGHAQRWHLGSDAGPVDAVVRDYRRLLDRPAAPTVLPLPHPSWRNTGWLARNPWFDEDLLPELRRRVAALVAPS